MINGQLAMNRSKSYVRLNDENVYVIYGVKVGPKSDTELKM